MQSTLQNSSDTQDLIKLYKKAKDAILRSFNDLNPRKEKTLIACSGGADSMALLDILAWELGLNPDMVVVGHIRHDIRSHEETDQDILFIKSICITLQVPMVQVDVFVSAGSKAGYTNIENIARDLRHDALVEMAKEQGCKFVATAHHADDQLETILMKLCRGCGVSGLTGIASQKIADKESGITYIRPMLTVTKEDALSICEYKCLPYTTDSTNADTTRARSGIRERVLPILKEYFPSCSENFNKTAELMNDVDELIQDQVQGLLNKTTQVQECSVITMEDIESKRDIIIGSFIREIYKRMHNNQYLDKLSKNDIDRVISMIREFASLQKTLIADDKMPYHRSLYKYREVHLSKMRIAINRLFYISMLEFTPIA